tara:strand:+ start:613 stop:1575 length:963 start_codon:yes stop_codon:yes gene_type:complete
MRLETLNICQVSLPGNIPIILENYRNFSNLYTDINFYIICPKSQVSFFKKKLNYINIYIISEDQIISFSKFKKISNNFLKKKNYYKKIQPRLKWYYQQILKISFVIDFINKNKKNIIIWDADTIILKKIVFFKHNSSVSYGTTSEYHKAYYETNQKILKKLPNYYISCIAQFISISIDDNNFLQKKLNNFKKRKGSISYWLSHLVFKAICDTHYNYNGSMFSEYELIGQSKLVFKKNTQTLISGLREELNGKLTSIQKKIAKILGYSYIAYEHSRSDNLSKNMLKRDQTWFYFIKLLIRKTSNKFFRGIKHIILDFIYEK